MLNSVKIGQNFNYYSKLSFKAPSSSISQADPDEEIYAGRKIREDSSDVVILKYKISKFESLTPEQKSEIASLLSKEWANPVEKKFDMIFQQLQGSENLPGFYKDLVLVCNEKMQEHLARRIGCLDDKDRADCLLFLAQNAASKDLYTNISWSVEKLPKENRADFIRAYCKLNPPPSEIQLIHTTGFLPEDEREVCHLAILETTKEEDTIWFIASGLSTYPREDRTAIFKKIAEKEQTDKIKSMLRALVKEVIYVQDKEECSKLIQD